MYHLTTQPPTQRPTQIHALKEHPENDTWESLVISLAKDKDMIIIHRFTYDYHGNRSCTDEILLDLNSTQAEIKHISHKKGL